MPAPLARPVASSTSAQILNSYQPKPRNLPLTNYVKTGDK